MQPKFKFEIGALDFSSTEPIKYLSLLTNEASGTSECLARLLRTTHVYKANKVTNLPGVIDSVFEYQSLPLFVQRRPYSLKATSKKNCLSLDWHAPGKVVLLLDEHTFNHHSYASRYIRFKKSQPAKGSAEFVARYSAVVEWKSTLKYAKDLRALVSEVFASTDLEYLSDRSHVVNLEPKGSLRDTHKDVHIKKTPLCLPLDFKVPETGTNLLKRPLDEVQYELQEFLSLLHLNALPDHKNSHVRATSTYEIPGAVVDMGISLESLSILSVRNVNPQVLTDIRTFCSYVSVQATTESACYLTLKVDGDIWAWTLKR